ncbi:MAG: hypothetical protein IPF54_06240 [Draconibacterium sp.]|nr:hypothetical protein [Draconibacterium sp.]
MVIKKGNIRVYGFLGFNALFQFDPFYFETDIRISVEVSYRGRSFFGVDLEFLLSGPEPWRAQGYAKIKVLFFSLKVKFNISWGENKRLLLYLLNPMNYLKTKISVAANRQLTAKIPDGFNGAVSFRSLGEAENKTSIYSSCQFS